MRASTQNCAPRRPDGFAASQARSAGVGDPASEASPNLEYSTHLNVPAYSCTLLDFGDSLELRGVYVVDPPAKRSGSTTERMAKTFSCYEDPERLEFRIRRTKRTCRHRCKALGKGARLWTMTKRGKFETTDECKDALTKWVRMVQAWSDKEFRYVAVPEQHADGRWHIHIAVQGFWDVGVLRRMWYRALGGTGVEKGSETPGGVNIAPVDARKNGSASVAAYIGKYISKSFGLLGKGKRSFWSSLGLLPHKTIRFRHPVVVNRAPHIELLKYCEKYRPGRYVVYTWDFAGTSGFTIKSVGS